MSIARAFTTRRNRQAADTSDTSIPHRSKTTRVFGGLSHHASIRDKISAPVALTHSTNVLAFTAPDINPAPTRMASVRAPMTPPTNPPSLSSSKSDDESDSGFTAVSTPPTSPDSPYPGDSRAMSPEPNHLSCYFTPPRHSLTAAGTAPSSTGTAPSSATSPSAAFPASDAPIIPKRAPSHTKKDGLARHRSLSRMSEQSARTLSSKASFSFSRSSSGSTSTSVASSASHMSTSYAAKPAPSSQPPSHAPVALASTLAPRKEYAENHPFGHELAKVSELVEEFCKDDPAQVLGAAPPSQIGSASKVAVQLDPIIEEEERELLRQGLKKFCAEDYLCEIQGLMTSFFVDAPRPLATVWI